MLRRTTVRRIGNYRQHNDREKERIYNERNRRILYNADGSVRLSGVAFLLWEEFRLPLLAVAGSVAAIVAYNKVVLYLSSEELAGERALDAESESAARRSGKLKADRYLVKPQRQIEDPDFLNIPSHAGKGVYSSKLMEGDDVSTDPLFAERRRN